MAPSKTTSTSKLPDALTKLDEIKPIVDDNVDDFFNDDSDTVVSTPKPVVRVASPPPEPVKVVSQTLATVKPAPTTQSTELSIDVNKLISEFKATVLEGPSSEKDKKEKVCLSKRILKPHSKPCSDHRTLLFTFEQSKKSSSKSRPNETAEERAERKRRHKEKKEKKEKNSKDKETTTEKPKFEEEEYEDI